MTPVAEITDATFEAEVLKAGGPVVVDFWAPWCGPCRMMAPVLEGAAEKLGGRIKFAKLNTDENPRSARRFQILAIPSIVVFNAGEEKDRQIGFVPPEELEPWLERFAAAAPVDSAPAE
jgi:thioredoxin